MKRLLNSLLSRWYVDRYTYDTLRQCYKDVSDGYLKLSRERRAGYMPNANGSVTRQGVLPVITTDYKRNGLCS